MLRHFLGNFESENWYVQKIDLCAGLRDSWFSKDDFFLKTLVFEFKKKISRVFRVSNLPCFNSFSRQSTIEEVLEFVCIFWLEQFSVIMLGSYLMNLKQLSTNVSFLLVAIRFELNSRSLCKNLKCLFELQLFDEHEKFDRTSSLIGSEAVCNLFCWRHDKARCFLGFKRGESLVVYPSFFERNVLADELDDVDFWFYVLGDRHWND